MLHSLLISLLSSFLFSPLAHAAPTNVTIDDTNGDAVTGGQITYSPALAWQAGQSCQNCTAKLDGNQAYDGTWHDASYNPPGGLSNSYPGTIISASADFTGTAVYIYCILTRSSSSPDGNTDMTFYVDDQEVGSFSRDSDGDKSYQYNQVVFAWSGLDGSTNHNVRLESGHLGQKALVLLDRIVYTTEDSSTTTSVIQTSSSSQQSSSSSSSGSSTQESSSSSQSSSSSPSSSSSSSSSGSSSSSQTPVSSGNSVLTSTPSVPSSSDTSLAFLPSLSVSDSSSSPSGSPSSDSDSSDSSSSNTGTIVGATVGGLGGLCLIVGIWWMCARRHRSRDEDEAAQAIQPFFSRNTFGGAPGGPGGGSGVRGDQLVGGGLGLNGQTSAFHGPTYVTLPVIGNAGGATRAGTGTKGSTTLMGTSTSSPITPTTLDTPHTPVSLPPPEMMYTTAKTWANTGAGNDPDQHPYAINVRSEKMRQLQAQQLQNQARSQTRGGVQGQARRLPNRTLPSPFSPIPLYAPTQEQSDVVSPSSASATLSAVESNSQIHSQGHTENMRENTELIRRWNSTGRPNGTGAGVGVGEVSGTDGWDDDSNATLEPVSPYSLLRPNRRREPAPLDDRPATPKNPPPRPRRSRVRPLTRILEVSHTGNEADNDVPEMPRGGVGNGGGQGRRGGGINIDADVVSDDGSDVRWQRKLANLFTPSSAAATAGDGSAQGVGVGKERQKGWEGTWPTPPPDPVVYNPSSRPQMRAGPTPPPPYQPGSGV
ncbi:hypothetical protein A7U60_g5505 [Sanghuangporus baumii]|uniref:Uncharacterized protein n=1 Tax=Sanghuangporus baumii TaxID=108892 RepID=A0A9Q5HWX2_SANBA|nr:hypothetical protein A7U60_g5505 [Sanghuangporus baumii]